MYHVPESSGWDRLPEEVRAVLARLLAQIREILGDELVGLYLYGSLSSGDFDLASSDVDFLAVTEREVSEAQFERLQAMHAEIAASGLPFATHLEGSYIPRDTWRRYDPANATHPTIGNDWPFQRGFHDINWIIERAIVRERGVTLFGPPPATLIDPISPEQLREASCQQIVHRWRETIHDEAFLRPRNYAAFATLTFCRALYTIRHGAYCSKPVAATWAEIAYPAWQPMIAWARDRRADSNDTTAEELAMVMTFLQQALAEAETQCGQQQFSRTP